jgi:hypothetical protein
VVLGTPANGTIQPGDGSKSTTLLTDDDNFSISTSPPPGPKATPTAPSPTP